MCKSSVCFGALHFRLMPPHLVCSGDGNDLVSFFANKRRWRQTWKCEAFAAGQTAWHIINSTNQQSFLTWLLYFCICAVFLGRHDTSEWTTCNLTGKLLLYIRAYKPAVSTLLILTFSSFEVGTIPDFFQFGILSNSGFCPIRDFVPFGILSILDFVQFGIFSNSGFCSIWILSNSGFCPIWDFVHSGFCPIRDFVQFGILSNSGFCPIRDFVQFGILSNLGFCPIRDFVRFGICPIRDLSNLSNCPFWILSNSEFCPIWDFVPSGFCPLLDCFNFGILSNSGFRPLTVTYTLWSENIKKDYTGQQKRSHDFRKVRGQEIWK